MTRPQEEEWKQGRCFESVELFKRETLGTGSYGAVCKAKCNQLICAAKLLYPVLLQIQTPDPGKKHRLPSVRFESECQFLSCVNHPNIVQYLGTYRDPETNAPVLLMELMDESLTHFLESSPTDVPYHIQVNLSYDIAQALAFLHTNGIIHRDLSSNNVLLVAGSRAKVADFGMSKLIDQNPSTMTMCPGASSYMPPEAIDEPPVYTEKLDNFSFGVLLVQIMTRLSPEPKNKLRKISNPQAPYSIPKPRIISKLRRFSTPQNLDSIHQTRILIPEVERRQAHINLITPTHPLLPIALQCLKDEYEKRPSSQELCQTLTHFKRGPKYEGSACQDVRKLLKDKDEETKAKDDQIQTLSEMMEDKEGKIQAQVETIDQLSRQLEQTTEQNKVLMHENVVKEREIKKCGNQIESNQEINDALKQTTTQLKQILSSKSSNFPGTDLPHHAVPNSTQLVKMLWKMEPGAPPHVLAGSTTAIGDKVYIRSNFSQDVTQFDFSSNQWQTSTRHPLSQFTITCVENRLTTVGGWSESFGQCSNQLYSYNQTLWEEHLPPMPTRRCTPGVEYARGILVVVGGRDDAHNPLTAVETLNMESSQWSVASSLPFPANQPTTTTCGSYIYLSTRYGASEKEKRLAFRASITELGLMNLTAKWERIASLPASYSSLVTVSGYLLGVGGQDSEGMLTKNVYQYYQATDSWRVVSQMSVARYRCLTASLPDGRVIVMGGDDYYRCIETASTSSNTFILSSYFSAP